MVKLSNAYLDLFIIFFYILCNLYTEHISDITDFFFSLNCLISKCITVYFDFANSIDVYWH